MTLQEFKAWFEGYTESLDSTPNEKQWKRVKERVAEIDGLAGAVHHYHHRDYWWPYISPPSFGYVASSGLAQNAMQAACSNAATPLIAMNAVGRADAAVDLN